MSRRKLVLLLALFFFSGLTGLVYEVVWTRLLTLVVGHTVHAVSTVLAAFMGGLALGSWWSGRTSDRQRNPLVVYAVLEAGIAVFALAVPWIFARLDLILGPLYRGLSGHFAWFSAFRFLFCFVLFLVPTVLMGATLPLLAHAVASSARGIGGRIGRVYAINTLGAVAGCFLTGFVLIEWLGLNGTLHAAALINLLVAGAALLLAPAFRATPAGATSATEEQSEPDTSASRPWILPVIYGCSGFVALALEVAWTRALIFSFFMGASTYAFATMLTVFLLGLGAGSMIASAWVDGMRRRMRFLVWAEIVVGVSALASGPALVWLAALRAREGTQASWLSATLTDLGKSSLVMLLPTLAMGAIFPVLARVYVHSVGAAGRGVGRLYFANTVGAIAGSLAAGFFLIPRLGLGYTILVLGVVSFCLAGALAFGDRSSSRAERASVVATAAGALLIFVVLIPMGDPIQRVAPDEKLLFYEEGASGTVAVVETPTGERRLQIDNVHIAGTNPIMATAHKSLAHMGVLLNPGAKDVLTVGFATGGTSRSYTLHPNLRRIDCVEIADTLLKTRDYFSELNAGVMDDPRYRVTLEDARTFLLLGDRSYDIISTDCTDLAYKSDANLYSREYFELCRRRLNPDGTLVVFLPFGGLTDPVLRGVLGTFHQVFPEGTVWYLNNYATHYFLLVGSKKPLSLTWSDLTAGMATPAVAADLDRIGLNDPYKLLSSFLLDAESLGRFVEGARLNTVDDPWVEFAVPRYRAPGLLDNMEKLLDFTPTLVPPVVGMSAEDRAALDRHLRAARSTLRGHIHLTRDQGDQARIEYEDALALTPGDRLLMNFLGIGPEARAKLEGRIAADPQDAQARLELGRLLRREGDFAASEAIFRHELASGSVRFAAAMGLAQTLEKQARWDEELRAYDEAESLADNKLTQEVARRGRAIAEQLRKLPSAPDPVQATLDLAQVYVQAGSLYEAIRLLEQRAAERAEPPVMEGLASLYLQSQMSERALEVAGRLVATDSKNAAGHYYALDALLKMGRLEDADRELGLALALDDKNASLWFNAARLRRMQGRDPECADALRKVLALGGSKLISLAQQDPVLAGSAPLREVWQGYIAGGGGAGSRP